MTGSKTHGAALPVVTVGGKPGNIFLANPLGTVIMRFPRGTGMNGIHEDLEHLIKGIPYRVTEFR